MVDNCLYQGRCNHGYIPGFSYKLIHHKPFNLHILVEGREGRRGKRRGGRGGEGRGGEGGEEREEEGREGRRGKRRRRKERKRRRRKERKRRQEIKVIELLAWPHLALQGVSYVMIVRGKAMQWVSRRALLQLPPLLPPFLSLLTGQLDLLRKEGHKHGVQQHCVVILDIIN